MKEALKERLLQSGLNVTEDILASWEANPTLLLEWIDAAPDTSFEHILTLENVYEEEPFKAHQEAIHYALLQAHLNWLLEPSNPAIQEDLIQVLETHFHISDLKNHKTDKIKFIERVFLNGNSSLLERLLPQDANERQAQFNAIFKRFNKSLLQEQFSIHVASTERVLRAYLDECRYSLLEVKPQGIFLYRLASMYPKAFFKLLQVFPDDATQLLAVQNENNETPFQQIHAPNLPQALRFFPDDDARLAHLILEYPTQGTPLETVAQHNPENLPAILEIFDKDYRNNVLKALEPASFTPLRRVVASSKPEVLVDIFKLLPNDAARMVALEIKGDGTLLHELGQTAPQVLPALAGAFEEEETFSNALLIKGSSERTPLHEVSIRNPATIPAILKALPNDDARLSVITAPDFFLSTPLHTVGQLDPKALPDILETFSPESDMRFEALMKKRMGGVNVLQGIPNTAANADAISATLNTLPDENQRIEAKTTLIHEKNTEINNHTLNKLLAEQPMALLTTLLSLSEAERLKVMLIQNDNETLFDRLAKSAEHQQAYYLLCCDAYLQHLRKDLPKETSDNESSYVQLTRKKVDVIEQAREKLKNKPSATNETKTIIHDFHKTLLDNKETLKQRRDTWLTFFLKCVGLVLSFGLAYSPLFVNTHGKKFLDDVHAEDKPKPNN